MGYSRVVPEPRKWSCVAEMLSYTHVQRHGPLSCHVDLSRVNLWI